MTVQFVSRRAFLFTGAAVALAGCAPSARQGGRPAPVATVEPAVALTPEQLQQAPADDRTRKFYEARQWRAAWTPQAAAQLVAAQADLTRHAIDPSRLAPLPAARDPAAREIAQTLAALTLGDMLSKGLTDPARVFEIFALERNAPDVDAGLSQALDQNGLAAWLAGLAPQDAEYQGLSAAYLRFLELARAPQPAAIPAGKAIHPGMNDPRVTQVAQALIAGGYLAAEGAADYGQDPVLDPALTGAVKALQDEQGINSDGVVGAGTIAVLNAGPMDRARQIALNLEARRWLKRQVPATRIDVNTAAALLDYYRDGKLAEQRRTVTGKRATPTPNLAASFSTVVANPPWNVPDGIAKKEVLPKGAAYLEANDMYVKDGRVIQRPGPKSSLGRVKFDMQDRYAIYLHDTPSKAAFQANERHASHGCVRVDGAVDFARRLAMERGVLEALDAALATTETTPVPLTQAVPVRLMYHTAWMTPADKIAFRPDIYGWDEALATALGMPPPVKRDAGPSAAADLGP